MTQRYTDPTALERMSKGLCPECGNPPEAHPIQTITMFNAGVCGFGGLLRKGVEDRIQQYREDHPDCECTDEYGPCEQHCEVLYANAGSSLYTVDEQSMIYLGHASELIDGGLSPYGTDVINRARENMRLHESGWITGDVDLGEELYSLVHQVENNIGPDYQTYWDDGYRIVKITGGPLLEDD